MRILRNGLVLATFILTALPAVFCQTAASTQPASGSRSTASPSNNSAPKATASTGAESNAKQAQPADSASVPVVRLENARLDALDADDANISLTDCVPGKPDPQKIVCDGKAYHLKVNDLALRAKVKPFHPGDHIRVDIRGDSELQDIRGAWSYPADGISAYCRVLVLAACFLALLGVAAAVTGGRPLTFIVGADYRYSNSKFQLALWFWVAISTYIAVVVFRIWWAGWDFFGGVNIPQNLLVLSGLSVITYGGAKAITTAKVDAAMNPVTPPGGVPRAPNNDPKNAVDRQLGQQRFFQDLVQNDFGQFDFGDFQMLVVTIVAVTMYLTLIFHFLKNIEFLKTVSLPDVDTTILAGFGLGQGAYLAKKAGGDPGKT